MRKLQVEITSEDEYPLPSDVKLAFYRIAQEAVANVVKHAKATRVVISLENQADQVRLGVVDNGRGFNPAEVTPMNMGLSTMRERAEGIGAKFNLQTTPGQGTQVWVQWGHHGHGE